MMLKNIFMKIILCSILLLALAVRLEAQDIWTVYNEQNSGLPNNTVRVLAVDGLNRKWIGTDFGLAMFNDTSWTVYNIQNSALTDNTIRALHIDNDNSVWIGTMSGGLYHFDGINWTNFNSNNSGIPANYVRSITIDSQGRKWIGTIEGLALFDDVNWKVWTTFNSALFSNNIASLKCSSANRVTAGTINGGIAVMIDTVMTVYTRNNNSGIPDNSVLQIALDSSGNHWFASPAAGVFVDWGLMNWQIYNQANSGMPVSASTCIFIDENDVQYIGTEQNGLVKRTMPDSWEYFTSSNSSLADNGLYALIKDKNGLLWIGTHQSGLQSLKTAPTATVEISESFKFYPNPASEILFFEYENLINSVKIFDLNGRCHETRLNANSIDVKHLQNGTYIIELQTEKTVKRAVFVKI
jgi:ligand-binding sensor domain-containing protein